MQSKIITIQRAQHGKQHPYFMMARATAQNTAISYEAAGLLAYLLSKPDDWKVQPHDLIRPGCSKNRVYKLLKELIAARYINRVEIRDDRGRMVEFRYDVYELPYPLPQIPEVDIPEVDIPDLVNSDITYIRPNKKQNIHNIDIHIHPPAAPEQPPPTPAQCDGDGDDHSVSVKGDEDNSHRQQLLRSAGVRGKPVKDLAARCTTEQITRVITYASANGLGPGWIVKELHTGEKGIRDAAPATTPDPQRYSAYTSTHIPIYMQEPAEGIEPESDPAAEPEFLTRQAAS